MHTATTSVKCCGLESLTLPIIVFAVAGEDQWTLATCLRIRRSNDRRGKKINVCSCELLAKLKFRPSMGSAALYFTVSCYSCRGSKVLLVRHTIFAVHLLIILDIVHCGDYFQM